MYVREL